MRMTRWRAFLSAHLPVKKVRRATHFTSVVVSSIGMLVS
jgi:hypothetical protein